MIQVYLYYKHLSVTAIFSFGVFSGLGELSELENLSRYPIILQILADIKFSSIQNKAHCLHVIVLAGPSQKKLYYQRVPNSKQSKLVFKWLCDAVANAGFMCGWTDRSDCVDYQILVNVWIIRFPECYNALINLCCEGVSKCMLVHLYTLNQFDFCCHICSCSKILQILESICFQ